jgi:bacillolysin/neutral peptidase B
MPENGLKTFAMHSGDDEQGPTVTAITEELESAASARSLAFEPENLDPETVARRYLDQMIASPTVPGLTAATPDENEEEYRTIGVETVPLTGTTVVKFAQYLHKIPVYGSLITVELEDDHSLLAVNSAMGDPTGVDPVASISPAQARDIIRDDADGEAFTSGEPPRLYYYFDNRVEPNRWRLVYIAKNVAKDAAESGDLEADATAPLPQLVDYVVDAHTGDLLARLPRTQSLTWSPEESDESDGLGVERHIRLQRDEAGNRRLSDTVRNVRTHDFNFRDARLLGGFLPGDFVVNPPDPWSLAAISAHANAADVAEFLASELGRDGLDNRGGPFISSINCTFRNPNPANREWRNAAWVGTQMIYGQRLVNGALRSYALASDVVAHEIIHGLTDRTARLEYQRESGALNESYSDIFGVIISNRHQPNIDAWNWEMGEDLNATGIPLRDLSDPPRRGQPDHMRDFQRLDPSEEPTQDNDNGGVHSNSGIHNKAAFNLITSRDGAGGARLFSPREAAALFYIALTQYLSRTSGFSDSRRGVELAARTLFRDDDPPTQARKLKAVAAAFDNVGITDG